MIQLHQKLYHQYNLHRTTSSYFPACDRVPNWNNVYELESIHTEDHAPTNNID